MKKILCVLAVLLCVLFAVSALAEGATVTVTAYRDSNNSGNRGKWERALDGVQLTLSGAAELTAVTDDEGVAVFRNVPAGDYTLTSVLPDGFGYGPKGTKGQDASVMTTSDEAAQTSAVFSVAEGDSLRLGIGTRKQASVSGQLWLDADGNGIRNEGEAGVAGVWVELYSKSNSSLYYQTWTDENGYYSFNAIQESTYRLRVNLPEGYMFTKYSKTGGKNRSLITTQGKRVGAQTVTVKAGEALTDQHVGLCVEGGIEGRCFLDSNYNGLYDEGEPALPGVKLEVYRANGAEPLASTTSDANGIYTFPALHEGTFKVNATLPEGCAFTVIAAGGNQFQARVNRRSNVVQNITVVTGKMTSVPVGAVKYATVSGIAYLDDNFSGTREDSEQIVSGLVVRLHDAQGNILVKDRTNGRGRFIFSDIAPGTYYITAAAKTGYAYSKLGANNVMINDSQGEGHSAVFRVEIGEDVTTLDMGMIRPGTVSGVFFADRNDNGLQDAGEGGLTGTVVKLMSSEGEHFSAVIGDSGKFIFDAVMPGEYWLRYELPETGIAAKVVNGGNTLTGADGVMESSSFKFTVGAVHNAPLAGGLTLGSVTGSAWEDLNGSGAKDEGEALLPGMTLTLTPSRSDLTAVSAVTGADGSFSFTGLHPDTYVFTITCPDGMVISRTDSLKLRLTPGVSEETQSLSVPMGAEWKDQLIGAVKPGALSGSVWLDENCDGLCGEEEATPAGLTISVIDESNGKTFAVLTTDEDGAFRTEGMVPGQYSLRFSMTDQLRAASAGDSTFTEEGSLLVMNGVTAVSGEEVTGHLLGLVRYNQITGHVWVDRGGSVQMLAGAKVVLTNAAGDKLQSAATGSDGAYAFTNLLPGTFGIAVQLPEGQLVVEPDDERMADGSLVSIMQTIDGRMGASGDINVTMTDDFTGLDIGSVLPGRIGDKVWLDENGNGLQDTDEYGFAGVTIEVIYKGKVLGSAVSDQYGYWLINNLYPATVTLRVTPPAEVKPTRQSTLVPIIASVLKETDDTVCESDPVQVISDAHNYNCDLGFSLRKKGVYPKGYGTFDTQDWNRIITVHED